MNWNKWIRQMHRWLSIVFTMGVIVNGVAVALKKYNGWLGGLVYRTVLVRAALCR